MNIQSLIALVGCVLGGIAFGQHYGTFEGVAVGFVIYALMPQVR